MNQAMCANMSGLRRVLRLYTHCQPERDADELFVWTNQGNYLSLPGDFLFFSTLLRHIAEKGQRQVFPSELRNKTQVNTKQDGFKPLCVRVAISDLYCVSNPLLGPPCCH